MLSRVTCRVCVVTGLLSHKDSRGQIVGTGAGPVSVDINSEILVFRVTQQSFSLTSDTGWLLYFKYCDDHLMMGDILFLASRPSDWSLLLSPVLWLADDHTPDAWGHGGCHRVTESVIEDRDEDRSQEQCHHCHRCLRVFTAHWAGHQESEDTWHQAIHHQQRMLISPLSSDHWCCSKLLTWWSAEISPSPNSHGNT